MLITPEQKPDPAADICDNSNRRQQEGVNDIYKTKGPFDNSNITDRRTGFDRGHERPCDESENEDVEASSSTLSDLKNCNVQSSSMQCSPQRLKTKFPPRINLSNSRKMSPNNSRRALFISDDVQEPMSPMSASPTSTSLTFPVPENDKHELIAGRLHLIRHTGNVSPSQSPSSPSRTQSKCFPFQVGPAFTSPSSSPPLPSSPTLCGKRKAPVYMRVYRCNMDHFALVSRDSSYSSRHVYLNMRHCRVIPGNCLGRFIIAGNCDSGSLMEFETTDLSSLEKWLDALQNGTPPGSPIRHVTANSSSPSNASTNSNCSPSIPKSPLLPTLTETDEEN